MLRTDLFARVLLLVRVWTILRIEVFARTTAVQPTELYSGPKHASAQLTTNIREAVQLHNNHLIFAVSC